MTAKEQVLDLLQQEQQKNTNAAKAARRKEWEGALRELFLQFEEWLKDAVDRGLLTVSTEPIVLEEKKLGPPLAVQRLVAETPAGVKFRISPKARYVAGADGRVDFERAPERISLLRKAPSAWYFMEFNPAGEGFVAVDLTEEAFWNRIRRLIS
jgi:hypothetical protein